jgi:hypothetical protein
MGDLGGFADTCADPSGTISNERLHQAVNADAARRNRTSHNQEAGFLRGVSDKNAG